MHCTQSETDLLYLQEFKEHEEWDIGTGASECHRDLSVYELHLNSNIQTEIVYIYIWMLGNVSLIYNFLGSTKQSDVM